MESLAPNDLIVSLQSSRISSTESSHRKYVTVAGMLLYSYDYMLTLDIELFLIWGSRWSLVKVLFLLARYIPFIDTVLLIFYMTLDGTSQQACSVSWQASGWLYVVSVTAAEILLTIRTRACWERARKLTIGLPIFFLVIWIPNYVFLGHCISSPVFVQPPFYAAPFGCVASEAKPTTVASWVGMMIYDAGLLLLMGVRGFPTLKDIGKKSLSIVVYRDGIVYYLLLFGLSLVNVVVIRCLQIGIGHVSNVDVPCYTAYTRTK